MCGDGLTCSAGTCVLSDDDNVEINTDTEPNANTDTDADADVDTDADADTDADTDTDMDADTDADICVYSCQVNCRSEDGAQMPGICETGLVCCDIGVGNSNTDMASDSDSDTEMGTDTDTDADTADHIDGLVFSPPSGTFEGSLSVDIAYSDDISEEIHYTTDGSIPTISSSVYDGSPITISSSVELQAEVFDSDGLSLAHGMAVYVMRSGDVTLDLPIVVLDNFGGGEPTREYERAVFMVFETEDGTASWSNSPTLAVRSGFHLRGETSAEFEKKPYRVELHDRFDEDQDWPVLGMPSESDWIMRGPYVDKALIRDAFHYGLGVDMGMPAPRFAFCEFYKNLDGGPLDKSDYEGVYLVVETIKNQKNRLDLKQLTPEDTQLPEISGGYIFKFEWMVSEEPILECPGVINCWDELEVHDPSDINAEQEAWLADYLYSFSQALHSLNFADQANGYAEYIDAASFADQIIINELGREYDSYLRSAFFYKDRDGLVFAGPLWDYNLSLGTGMTLPWTNLSTIGWTYETAKLRDPNADWFNRLLDDPAFVQMIKDRWKELRSGLLSDAALNERIDTLVAPLSAAAARNFERWPNLKAGQLGGTGSMASVMFTTPISNSWEEQVTILREWLMDRVAWMDTQWR